MTTQMQYMHQLTHINQQNNDIIFLKKHKIGALQKYHFLQFDSHLNLRITSIRLSTKRKEREKLK